MSAVQEDRAGSVLGIRLLFMEAMGPEGLVTAELKQALTVMLPSMPHSLCFGQLKIKVVAKLQNKILVFQTDTKVIRVQKLNWCVNILMVSRFLVPLGFLGPYAYHSLFTANSAPRECRPKIRKGKERVNGGA